MSSSGTTYGVLGVGSLGAAVVTGLCREDPPPVVLSPRSAATVADLAARHPTVVVAADNQAVVDAADVVVVSVLPGRAEEVLAPLRFRAGQVVSSVMAGVGLAEVGRLVEPARATLADPLPSVARRRGGIPVHPSDPDAVELWGRLGEVVATDDEPAYHALAVPSATIAAHLEHLALLADWVADHGVPRADAVRYVAALHAGVADGLVGTPDLDGMVAEVATPGGFNEMFARDLRDAGVPQTVRTALDAVHRALTDAG